MSQNFKILLYYKYVKLTNPELIKSKQKQLCEKLNIKGRIIISNEGINGTVAGKADSIDVYMAKTENAKAFSNMDWKVSNSNEQVFPKLKVVVRNEIVTFGFKKKGKDVPLFKKANYIEPEELYILYEKNANFLILDTRNLYEANIGRFKNALIAPIENFRDFPEFAKKLTKYKYQEVVTYCTGGIRCEKASTYLREIGFKKVRQLHGGIHEYCRKTDGKHFEGEMFVFDKRLHVPVNKANPTILTTCIYCQKPITRYIDCSIKSCHSLFICCETCEGKYSATCSDDCLKVLQDQKVGINSQPQQLNQYI